MAKSDTDTVKVKAIYDLSVYGRVELWGVCFEETEEGFIAELPKYQAQEMIDCGRVELV